MLTSAKLRRQQQQQQPLSKHDPQSKRHGNRRQRLVRKLLELLKMSHLAQPPGRLEGRIAIVTGASSGLGRAISLAYAREGAVVVCADLQPEARIGAGAGIKTEGQEKEGGKSTAEVIESRGGKAMFVRTDVSSGEDWRALVKKTVEKYGRIDILVNNAGISVEAKNKPVGIHETPDEWFDQTMAVNARSIFLGCKHVIGQMLQQDEHGTTGDRGWIVNLASVFGLVGTYCNPSYAAAKGAVSNLTRQVATDYAAQGIHCNAICPGYLDTAVLSDIKEHTKDVSAIAAKHPLHGIGRVEDVVGTAVFLASGEARWITGVNLPVDGGYTAQ